MSRYDYEELRQAALNNHDNIIYLINWLDEYDPSAWNGEYYDIDDGLRIFPIYEEVRPDEYIIIDYEIR